MLARSAISDTVTEMSDSAPGGAGSGDTGAVPLERGAVGELFWSIADAVVLLRGRRVIAWNPAAEQLFHVPEGEATADGFDLLAPFGPAGKQLAELLDTLQGPVRLEPPDRDLVLEAVAWRLRGSDVIAVVFRDLTPQVRFERGLREIAAFCRDLLLAPPTMQAVAQSIAEVATRVTEADFSGVLLLRPGTRTEVRHFAYDAPRELFPDRLPRAVGMLGLPLESRAPTRVGDIRHHPRSVGLPEHHPPIGPLLAVPLLRGDEIVGEIACAREPGRPFGDTDEALLADLAGHAAVALEWVDAVESAAEEEERRREVTSAARHDIASPLSVVGGYLSMLERRYDAMTAEQRHAAFAASREALSRVHDFARRLLLDDRLEAGDTEPHRVALDVAEVLQRVAADHAVVSAHRGVRVLARAEPGCPPVFKADPAMVREVLDNLVNNAVKHSASGDLVHVVARSEAGEFVRFDVTDLGPGIPPDEQAIVFDRYRRGESSRASRLPGLGLGLSIVRRLVEAHGGVVGVSSRPGEGSTFWVTFPVSGYA